MKAIIRMCMPWLVGLSPMAAHAADWNCRNTDMEIRCDSGRCQASPEGGFTPFDVTIGDEGRRLSVCAYSGCWEGKARRLASGRHVLVSGRDLAWNGTTPGKADFIVGLDMEDGLGFVQGEGFAMPMSCVRGD